MPSKLTTEEEQGWHGNQSETVEQRETPTVTPTPMLLQTQACARLPGTTRPTDSLLIGTLLSVGCQLVSWLLHDFLMSLLAFAFSWLQPVFLNPAMAQPWLRLLLMAAFAAGTGYLGGRLAPRHGVQGILIGRAIAFVGVTGWIFFALASDPNAANLRETYPRSIFFSLFLVSTVTLTEVLIARGTARRFHPFLTGAPLLELHDGTLAGSGGVERVHLRRR